MLAATTASKTTTTTRNDNGTDGFTRNGNHKPAMHSPPHRSVMAHGLMSSMAEAGAPIREPHQTAPPPCGPNYHDAATQYSASNSSDGTVATASSQYSAPQAAIYGGDEEPEIARTTRHAYDDKVEVSKQQVSSPSIKRRQPATYTGPQETPQIPGASPSKRPRTAKGDPKVLPQRYELCDVKDIVILIANMIAELIETNDNLPLRDIVLTRFHSRTSPGISVIDYLQRLAKHAALTPPLLLSMVYYIDLLCSMYPAFTITSLTVHRFLITAATVAAKGLSDSFWNNTTYARVGGVKLEELGLLELEFLHRVDWRIVPNPEVLVDYYHGLVSRTSEYKIEPGNRVGTVVSKVVGLHSSETDESTQSSATPTNPEKYLPTHSSWDNWMKDVAENSTGGFKAKEGG